MKDLKAPYRVKRVVDERSGSTRWYLVNAEDTALVWTTDPAEAYRLADLLMGLAQ